MNNDKNKHLLKISYLYIFFLFCIVPSITGIFTPYHFHLAVSPFDYWPMRLIILIATGWISSLLIFLLFYLTSSYLPRLERFALFSLLPLSSLLTGIQIIMYQEYGTDIDSKILELFKTGGGTIWIYALKEYNALFWIFLILICSWGATHILYNLPKRIRVPGLKIHLFLSPIFLSCILFMVILRPQIKEITHYSPFQFAKAPLFQTLATLQTINSHYNMGYKNILDAAAPFQGGEQEEIERRLATSIPNFIHHQSSRPPWLKEKPSHVFLFLMESYGYNLLSDPKLSPLVPHLKSYEESGISTPHLLAAGSFTSDAIQSISSGTSYLWKYPVPRTLKRFSLDTLPKLMAKTGYTPLFLSGSYRKFRAKGAVCEAHGYDSYMGCPDLAPQIKSNEWGVNDANFFEWSRHITKDLHTPHFITFLNVSNHAPFDAPLQNIPTKIEKIIPLDRFNGKDQSTRIKYAKHIYYADREIGKNVDFLHHLYPKALFVFIGDHESRKIKGNPTAQVPFILWNPEILTPQDTSLWFGTQMDILATLANLVLPEGSSYSTLGSPVWDKNPLRVSAKKEMLITSYAIYNTSGSLIKETQLRKTAMQTRNLPKTKALLKASALNALSWGFLYSKEPSTTTGKESN